MIKVKYFDEKSTRLKALPQGDLIDLRVREVVCSTVGNEGSFFNPVTLLSGAVWKVRNMPWDDQTIKVKLGVAMELPDGHKAQIFPRGSTFKNFGLIQTNSVGQVDESFCGPEDEWWVNFLVTRDTVIPFDARIAQFEVIEKQKFFCLREVEELTGKNRGSEGSTGIL